MRYIFTLLALLAIGVANAQFDMRLLHGKWICVGMKKSGVLIHKDSIDASIEGYKQLQKGKGTLFQIHDTVLIKEQLKKSFKQLRKAYIKFNIHKNTGVFYVPGERSGAFVYRYLPGNKLEVRIKGDGPEEQEIITLTNRDLIISETLYGSAKMIMYLRRK